MGSWLYAAKPIRLAVLLLWINAATIQFANAQAPERQVQERYEAVIAALGPLYDALEVTERAIDRSLFDIAALADRLGPDPEASFQFVRDRIRYEPYVGVLRGAGGTLLNRAGNALDRSLLLAELLAAQGRSVRIVHGTLRDELAAALVNRAFEPINPAPAAIADPTQWIRQLVSASGIPAPDLLTVLEQEEARGEERATTLTNRTGALASNLITTLRDAGVELPSLTPVEQLIAEARDHYWVQYLGAASTWIDLDTVFANSSVGQTFTVTTEVYLAGELPADLYHQLGIKVVLEIANDQELLPEIVLIDQRFSVADRDDEAITLANVATPSVQSSMTAGLTAVEAVQAIGEFVTVLMVGDQVVLSQPFDLTGHLYGALPGTAIGNAERLARPVGGGFEGAAGALDIFGGQPNPASAQNRIENQWVEYTLSTPTLTGDRDERVFRRYVLPSPAAVSGALVGDQTQPLRLRSLDEVRTGLHWSVELLPVTGDPSSDYLVFAELQNALVTRQQTEMSLRVALGLPVVSATLPDEALLSQRPVRTTSLVSLAAEFFDGRSAIGGGPTVYRGEAGLIGLETSIASANVESVHRVETFDIAASGLRVVGPAGLNAPVPLWVTYGVGQTVLERLLLEQPRSVDAEVNYFSAVEVLEAAAAQGVQSVVVTPGPEGVTLLGELDIPEQTRLELQNSLARGLIIVAPANEVEMAGGQFDYAWWSIDPTRLEVIGVSPGGRGMTTAEKEFLAFLVGVGVITSVSCLIQATTRLGPVRSVSIWASCIVAGIGASVGSAVFVGPHTSGLVAIIFSVLSTVAAKIGVLLDSE